MPKCSSIKAPEWQRLVRYHAGTPTHHRQATDSRSWAAPNSIRSAGPTKSERIARYRARTLLLGTQAERHIGDRPQHMTPTIAERNQTAFEAIYSELIAVIDSERRPGCCRLPRSQYHRALRAEQPASTPARRMITAFRQERAVHPVSALPLGILHGMGIQSTGYFGHRGVYGGSIAAAYAGEDVSG